MTSNFTPPQRQLPRKGVTSRAYTRAIARRETITVVVALAFLGAAAYEAAVALEWIHMGRKPGDEAGGQVVATALSLVAVLLALGLGVVGIVRLRRNRVAPMIPLAAAAWMTAHYYAFDAYYLPTLQRFSENGSVAAAWVYGVAVCAALLAAGVWFVPRGGEAPAALLVIVCALTVVGMGIGH